MIRMVRWETSSGGARRSKRDWSTKSLEPARSEALSKVLIQQQGIRNTRLVLYSVNALEDN